MSNLIITESHKLLDDEMKDILEANNLSCTFLPKFFNNNKTISSTLEYFISISNTNAMKLDGISNYYFKKMLKDDYNNDIVNLIIDTVDVESDSLIFLAQDNDTSGHLMANLLYYKLLDNNINKDRIKRVVGIEKVFRNKIPMLDIYLANFYEENLFYAILNRKRLENKFVFEAKKESIDLMAGYRNIYSLYKIANIINNGDEVIINKKSNEVCLATYITNGLLSEEYKNE